MCVGLAQTDYSGEFEKNTYFTKIKKIDEPGIVACAYDPSINKAEAGELLWVETSLSSTMNSRPACTNEWEPIKNLKWSFYLRLM